FLSEAHTGARAPQRAREKPSLVALVPFELAFSRLDLTIELTHLGFDLRQHVAWLVAALAIGHKPLLELETDIAGSARWRARLATLHPAPTGWRRRLRAAIHGLTRLGTRRRAI